VRCARLTDRIERWPTRPSRQERWGVEAHPRHERFGLACRDLNRLDAGEQIIELLTALIRAGHGQHLISEQPQAVFDQHHLVSRPGEELLNLFDRVQPALHHLGVFRAISSAAGSFAVPSMRFCTSTWRSRS
jgi:hypothetical protein